jgi:hypothetical protein
LAELKIKIFFEVHGIFALASKSGLDLREAAVDEDPKKAAKALPKVK